MRTISSSYILDGISYPLIIVIKRKKNYSYRFKDGSFLAYVPIGTSYVTIKYHLDQCAKSLMDRYYRHNSRNKDKHKENGYVYYLGEISSYTDEVSLYKEKRKEFKELLKSRINFYCLRMNNNIRHITRLSTKPLKSRFGSNSRRTHTISFSVELMHYDIDIIDSVVIHELCHDYYFDHGKNFYNLLSYYCPRHKEYKHCLTKGIHKL